MASFPRPALLSFAAIGIAATAAFRPLTVLELENAGRGSAAWFAIEEDARFSVTSQHSMYEQPVTEDFVVDGEGRLVLTAVSSPSAAVREYFGLSAAGERHAIERAMREIVFRVAAGAPQTLRIGGEDRSFLQFGEHGDRLVMRAIRRPAVAHWLAHPTTSTR